MGGLLLQGVDLMLVGMGTVFVFLAALVGVTQVMSRLVVRYLPDVAPPAAPSPIQDVDAERVAAISAAIARYRSERGRGE